MRESFWSLPRSAQLLTGALLFAFLAVAVILPPGRLPVITALVAVFALTALVKPVPNPTGGVNVPILAVSIVTAMFWQPHESLLGVGIGSFLGLVLLRRTEVWRAASNGLIWGLPAAAASVIAHEVLNATSPALEFLMLAAFLAAATYRVCNMTLFSMYRSARFGRPFLRDLHYNLTANWPNQLYSAPLAALFMAAAIRWGSGDNLSLGLTALSALTLPLARGELTLLYQRVQTLQETVDAIVLALDRVVPGARAHGERVSALAVETGRRMGMSERALQDLKLAARLHDLGQMAAVAEGDDTSRDHAVVGARILAPFPDPMVAEMVRAHHDPWTSEKSHNRAGRNGSSLGSRILAVAEVYDSARSGLIPFAKPHTHAEATQNLLAMAGIELDPRVVSVLLKAAREQVRAPASVE